MSSQAERLLLLYADLASAQPQRPRILLEREILSLPNMESTLNNVEWQETLQTISEIMYGWQQHAQRQPELDAEHRKFLMLWLSLLHAHVAIQTKRLNNEVCQTPKRRKVLEPCLAALWTIHSLSPGAEPGRSWVIDQLLRLALTVSTRGLAIGTTA
jgi:hypothetical protein